MNPVLFLNYKIIRDKNFNGLVMSKHFKIVGKLFEEN